MWSYYNLALFSYKPRNKVRFGNSPNQDSQDYQVKVPVSHTRELSKPSCYFQAYFMSPAGCINSVEYTGKQLFASFSIRCPFFFCPLQWRNNMLRRLTFVPCVEKMEYHDNPILSYNVACEPCLCC